MKYTLEERRYGIGIVAPGLPAVLVKLGRQTALEPGSNIHFSIHVAVRRKEKDGKYIVKCSNADGNCFIVKPPKFTLFW